MNDFELDVVAASAANDVDINITSKSLCTPGCITGILQGCSLRTASCNCHFEISTVE